MRCLYGLLMNTKTKGDISEAAVVAALLQAGYTVSPTWGDNSRYDLVIDDGKLHRVQVKTGRVRNGCILFNVCSINLRTQVSEDYHGQVEYFGVFVSELNKCYLVPIKDTGSSIMSLRLVPTKNNQVKRIWWASDYEILRQHVWDIL